MQRTAVEQQQIKGAEDGETLGGQGGIVPAVAVVSALAATLSDGAATGLTIWDIILRAVVAVLFVAASSVSPRWAAIVVAMVTGVFVGATWWALPVAVGLLLAIGSSVLSDRSTSTAMRALSAGLVVQGLLRLPAIGFFGLPSIVAGLSFALVFYFGYRTLADRHRRIARRAIAAAVVVVGAISVVGGLVLLSARADVERGIDAARGSLSAARGGDPEAVVAELELAAEALGAAESRSSSILAQPLRLVPVAAQHRHAVVTATRRGSQIASQASRATVDADISSVTMSTGSVDLSALSAMEEDLADTVELLDTGVRELDAALSPWLLPPIASRMESLTDEMRSVLPEARVAADAARVLPGLLGADGPRRYFVAFGSPAESRELGGFIGSWALLELDDGTIRRIDAGRAKALYDIARAHGPLDAEQFPVSYVEGARPDMWPQNIASSPQLSVVAEASRELFDGLGGGPIDGFVYIDGYALGAMLQLTGPVTVEGVDQPINAGNADSFFFDEQYRLDDRDELKAELTEIFAVAFDDLLDSALPGPERLGKILGPAARQGRLQVATFSDEENTFLQSVKLQRDFGASFSTEDAFALVQSNVQANKLDLYLRRDVTYDVTVNAKGELRGLVSVALDFDLPADAPDYVLGTTEPGVNEQRLSLYTRHALNSVHIDGEPVEARVVTEFGIRRYEITVVFPATSSRLVEFELVGLADFDERYELSIWQQPLVHNDIVTVTYQKGDKSPTTQTVELVENLVLSFDG